MNKQYEMVADFQTKMNQPVADKPKVMELGRRFDRYDYMLEELIEFLCADKVVDQADAMIDLIYLAIGTMVEIGVKPEALFEIVHNANMSKLWPDGKPHLNPETGKVIKPPTFVRPEPLLEAEIERQVLLTEAFDKLAEEGYEFDEDFNCTSCGDAISPGSGKCDECKEDE